MKKVHMLFKVGNTSTPLHFHGFDLNALINDPDALVTMSVDTFIDFRLRFKNDFVDEYYKQATEDIPDMQKWDERYNITAVSVWYESCQGLVYEW